MEKITALAKLLGADNEKRLKEEVTNILIDYIRTDLEESGMYLVDFEKLSEEVATSIQEEIKDKYKEILRNNVEQKLQELMGKGNKYASTDNVIYLKYFLGNIWVD